MSQKSLLCVSLFLASAACAAGQETRTFAEAHCKYTLPGPDWEWLDPQLVRKTIGKNLALAKNPQGLGFFLIYKPLANGERPTSASFSSYEAGFLESGKLEKLGASKGTFRGIATYQIDARVANGGTMAHRVMYANNGFYILQAMNGLGPLAAADAEAILGGFDFTSEPEPVALADSAVANGRAVGQAIGTLGFIGGIVFLVFYLRKRQKSALPPEAGTQSAAEAESLKPAKRGRLRWRQSRLGQAEQEPEPPTS